MIRVVKVNKWFNRFRRNRNHVINNTKLDFGDNGLVALLGPSGSGKTTLLNVIGGLDKVNSGKIYVNDKKITRLNTYQIDKIRNLNIGYIFQDYKLVDNMSVYDNVALSLKTIGIKNKKEIDKRVTYVLEKVGMYRFRKRPASMLSGGERQRVGIARAIVKNPSIIIADEPTGNLDSKNSLEIMNIIKKISEDRLVILVTHEVNLAKFYATRIIELEDGKIVSDYENNHEDDLDYSIDNNIYLKDIPNHDSNKELDVDIYRDKDAKLNIEIVLKGNNIFIKSLDDRKIEIVDDNSSIEFINDHYKRLSKKDIDQYEFDYSKLENKQKLRYSSIFNPITFITNGILKVLDYSLVKKLLLIGFFLSGFFILMSNSRIMANLQVYDKDFVTVNTNYLKVNMKKVRIEDYERIASREDVNYVLPGSSKINLNLKVNDYYQTANNTASISGSLSGLQMITKEDIVVGRYPENEFEIVLDKMVINDLEENASTTKMMGLKKMKDFLGRKATLPNIDDYTIVGFVDLQSPCIYMSSSHFIDVIYSSSQDELNESLDEFSNTLDSFADYNVYFSRISLKEGSYPVNDYETMVSISHKEEMKLNKEIDVKIDGRKLKVVGYFDSEERFDNKYFVNKKMIRNLAIVNMKNLTVFPKDKDVTLTELQEKDHFNVDDTYLSAREKYVKGREKGTKVAITSSVIVLVISLVEIVLMLRSSFLSRIKEVGIYRAIGLKKKDIYIMFSGEILAITTLTSLPGIFISSYIFYQISTIKYLTNEFLVNPPIIIGTILMVYIFNLFFGLLPVMFTLRKRPAQILARTDI